MSNNSTNHAFNDPDPSKQAIDRRILLIVNADDFGQSAAINRGIIEAHQRGIVTSTSLMVRGAAMAEAVQYGRENPALAIGLHLDFGEWYFDQNEWKARYEVVFTDDEAAVRAEVERQLQAFRECLGRDPTHVDSHQHVHRRDPVRLVAQEVAREIGVPLRHERDHIRYCGDFFGQDFRGAPIPDSITVESLVRIIQALPAGITELACHPGYDDEAAGTYRHERPIELVALCDSLVKETIRVAGVQLCSFATPAVVSRFRPQLS
jgi:predicted glycoside hydrolase/deacetylase ChbG (UPF0249 family)